MLSNFFKVALRNIWRNKAQTTINVLGLSIGLACSFLIVLWVQDELSYDHFHEQKEQIFRIMRHAEFGGEIMTTSSIPAPLDDVLDEEYPEIRNTILMSWESQMLLSIDDIAFRADGRYFGADFFEVFSFPLVMGSPATALQGTETIAINASLAQRLFGEDWRSRDDLLGRPIRIDNERDATLTGIFEDVPETSFIDFEFVLPIQYYSDNNQWVSGWGNSGLRGFVRLEEGVDHVAVSAKIKDIVDEHVEDWNTDLFLQPITDAYLKSDYDEGVWVGGRIEYVQIFLWVAVFIILIASINFMNLSTARSAYRAKEIGVRKSVGAGRNVLARQFLGESILTTAIAFVAAIVLVVVALPTFSTLTDKSVGNALLDPSLILLFLGVALVTGLIAGTYPALYLSSFNVISVLRSTSNQTGGAAGLRKGLVVFQFILSIILVAGTYTVYTQLDYIRSKDLGLDRDNLVFMELEGGIEEQYESFRNELIDEPGIVNVATSTANPLSIGSNTVGFRWQGKDEDDTTLYSIISTQYDLVETMDMEVVSGRTFSRDFGSDSTSFVINERAAQAMGIQDPVGEAVTLWGTDGEIVGVVKDFHTRSLYEPIEPVVFRFDPPDADILYVRLAAGQTADGLASLERLATQFNPEYPFEYQFMDDEFEETYRSEVVIGSLANAFALIALLIACLGLFGLASFTAERRTKEIGIRKVLGASVPGIVTLLSREFLVLVGGAFVIAAPVSYWLMTDWLGEFEYHAEFGLGVLLVAGLGSMLVAWLTVGYQSIRVATANPVKALRSE